jgi:hypothetical protein
MTLLSKILYGSAIGYATVWIVGVPVVNYTNTQLYRRAFIEKYGPNRWYREGGYGVFEPIIPSICLSYIAGGTFHWMLAMTSTAKLMMFSSPSNRDIYLMSAPYVFISKHITHGSFTARSLISDREHETLVKSNLFFGKGYSLKYHP